MYSKSRFVYLCFLFFLLCSVTDAAEKKTQTINELQVLIDVSGSMKKNDPDNLRIPAVKLLINLLPEGTKVGLWLFAEKTTELVKTGIVSKQWKKNALAKVSRIHSSGLFTNIEDAIEHAAKDWFNSSTQQHRHLILLTDGMVDISKDIMQSAESRERVMSEQVPLLQQAGAKVQTIALSAEADAELLNKLAFDTGGWSETATSAEQLQKVFFKLFKQAIPQDTLPITGNSFSVDDSIKEFSILIFKESGAPTTQLLTPDKKKIDYRSKLKEVSWLSEENYDLVTIKKPKAGEWIILAKMDPENQVMIVTDLKFEIDALPNYISLNESVEISGFFTDQQQLISREEFLSLIDISIQQQDGEKWTMPAVTGKLGLFSRTLGSELKKGRHTLRIIADGKTFKRELSKTLEIIESLVLMEKQVDIPKRTVTIKLIPNKLALDMEMMAIEASITQIGKKPKKLAIEKKARHWELVVSAPESDVSQVVNFSIMANTLQGKAVSPRVHPIIIDNRLFKVEEPKAVLIEPENETIEDSIPESNDKALEENDAPLDEAEPVHWMRTSMVVGVINILLITAGYFGFRFMRKQALSKQEQLLSRLD